MQWRRPSRLLGEGAGAEEVCKSQRLLLLEEALVVNRAGRRKMFPYTVKLTGQVSAVTDAMSNKVLESSHACMHN